MRRVHQIEPVAIPHEAAGRIDFSKNLYLVCAPVTVGVTQTDHPATSRLRAERAIAVARDVHCSFWGGGEENRVICLLRGRKHRHVELWGRGDFRLQNLRRGGAWLGFRRLPVFCDGGTRFLAPFFSLGFRTT